jgi:hypothetical protein
MAWVWVCSLLLVPVLPTVKFFTNSLLFQSSHLLLQQLNFFIGFN